MKKLTEEVKNYALGLSADVVSVVSVEDMAGAPEGHRPTDYLSNAKSVLIWAVKLLDAIIDRMPDSQREFTANNFEAEAINQDIAFRSARFLEKLGYSSYPVSYYRSEYAHLTLYDPIKLFGSISCRHAAERAELGEIGVHSLLITPEFGPRHRMSAVITDTPLEARHRLETALCAPEQCGFRSAEDCPVGATSSEGYHKFDKHRCSEHGIRVMGSLRCSMCMAVRPRNV